MRSGLHEATFDRLLAALDADRERAAERYEDLRRTLVRFFEWRGGPFPEECADETLDRVARRLAEGVDVAHIRRYAYTVARHVLLEAWKGPDGNRAAGSVTEAMAAPAAEGDGEDKEARLSCLDACLCGLPAEGRTIILEYYRDAGGARIETRRELARRLGIKADALANRAQRLRDKLQTCVRACLERK